VKIWGVIEENLGTHIMADGSSYTGDFVAGKKHGAETIFPSFLDNLNRE